jgi:phosphate transport system permease protein
MVDVTAATPDAGKSVHTTNEASRRLRRRYGFEQRFKFAGMLAIALATLSLVALLWTVLGNAIGAMRQTYITLPVVLDAAELGIPNDADADKIRSGNFEDVVKKALRTAMPSVKGRSDKRLLYKLASDGAALSLRAGAMADQSLLGKTKKMALLASDDADLWVRGYGDKLEVLPSQGAATATSKDNKVEVTIKSDSFQTIIGAIKQSLREAAVRMQRQAAAQQRGVTFFENRLKDKSLSENDRKRGEAALLNHRNEVSALTKKAADFEARAKTSAGFESLTSELPSFFIRMNNGVVKIEQVKGDTVVGLPILPLSSMDVASNGKWQLERLLTGEVGRRINDQQAIWLDKLQRQGLVSRSLNWAFLSSSNSREAELAGVWGAIVGSFWTMLVTFLLAFPIGVMAAIYLEEFAPSNGITDFIEVNINNLAAVPSIVFGLLGLAVFIGFFGVPRSTALAGGIVLALMTLPTIIIAGRAAIKAVPPSIREAALGVGASKVQTVSHHVLPLAMPGILTGTIIGMAQALGETAPLLMIGMFAFIREVPSGVVEPATALPVQIYQWSDFPERLFDMKTAGAIVVLLLFLIVMNALAILLRRRFERKW